MAKRRRHVLQSEWGRALAQLMASSRRCKTQNALAKRSGVAQATVGRILRGEVDPQTGTMSFLADALGMPLAALLSAHQRTTSNSFMGTNDNKEGKR